MKTVEQQLGYILYYLAFNWFVPGRKDLHSDRVVRAHAPKPGDLVVENSTMGGHQLKGPVLAFGWLKEVKQEPRPGDWDENDGPRPTEEAWYIEPLGGGEPVRWTNAGFWALPFRRLPNGSPWHIPLEEKWL